MIYSVKLMNYGKFCKKKKPGMVPGRAPAPAGPVKCAGGGAPRLSRGGGPAGAGAFTVSRGEGPRRGKPRAPEDTGVLGKIENYLFPIYPKIGWCQMLG